MHLDARGAHLWYIASIFIRDRKTGRRRLLQRSRNPGTGQALAQKVNAMGLRAFHGLATTPATLRLG